AYFDNIRHGFSQGGLVPRLVNDGHAHGHRNRHDGNDDHDFDERESCRAARRPPADIPNGLHRAILEVIANMAESTLSRRNPTPTAMTMMSTGSIMLVMTRRAIASSF